MNTVCLTCLSPGRCLYSLGPNYNCFQTLFSEFHEDIDWNRKVICWECRAILDKTRLFIRRAKLANAYFKNEKPKLKLVLSSLISQSKFSYDYEYNHEKFVYEKKTEHDNRLESLSDKKFCKIGKFGGSFIINSDWKNEELNNGNVVAAVTEVCYDDENLLSADEAAEKLKNNIESEYNDEDDENHAVKRANQVEENNKTNESLKNSPKFTEDEKKELLASIQTAEAELLEYREFVRRNGEYTQCPFKCESCIKGFFEKENYDMHMLEHSKISGNEVCSVCQCRFLTSGDLADHTLSHYTVYTCKECPFKSNSNNLMLLHYEELHSATAETYPWSKGDLPFHENNSRECSICNKKFKNRASHRRHDRMHMVKDRKAYCVPCNRQFINITTYKNHLKLSLKHAKPESWRYKCTECDRRFCSREAQRSHYGLAHLKGSMWRCEPCGLSFSNGYALKNHIEQVHEKMRMTKTIRTYNLPQEVWGKIGAEDAQANSNGRASLQVQSVRGDSPQQAGASAPEEEGRQVGAEAQD